MRKLLIAAFGFITLASASCHAERQKGATESNTIQQAEEHHLSLLIAGDLMQHGPQIRAAKTANGYDYSDVFARVKPEISAADIAVANFEVTLAGEPLSITPLTPSSEGILL